jgi:hypothetical protein
MLEGIPGRGVGIKSVASLTQLFTIFFFEGHLIATNPRAKATSPEMTRYVEAAIYVGSKYTY